VITTIGSALTSAVFTSHASADGNGELTFVEVVKDDELGDDRILYGPFSVTVSPDGKHLYAASIGVHPALAVFSRDSSTGKLTYVEMEIDGVGGVDGLHRPFSVTVSPDGKHLYAAGNDDDAVAVFSRDSTTGNLTFVGFEKDGVGGVDGLNGAHSVTVSPDGRHLYAAGVEDHAVAVFSRDSMTGVLTFVEVVMDGVGGVDGIRNARSVTVSLDGNHVYVASTGDSAAAVFSRNPTTGKLTFVEAAKDGEGGVDGLFGAHSVTVSPDGNHVYAASNEDQAVAVFSRNSTTGELAFVEAIKDGEASVDGLETAYGVTVSPDGEHVYTAGASDNAVAVFSRNSTTGELTFVEVKVDSFEGVDGLRSVRAVTVSPDGKHVYAAGTNDNALAVFSRNAPTTTADLEVVKTDSPDPVTAGTNLTYTITVTNNSTSTAATNVEVKDKLPTGTSLVSANATAGLCTGGTELTCTFATLAAGALTTATIVVKVDAGTSGPLTNVASTTADTLDSVISNNSFKAVTQVTTGPRVPSVSVWALAALSAVLLLTFSGRIRRRIMRRAAVGE
jgi:uncharacterized repeat protein (TIGR01451 family)